VAYAEWGHKEDKARRSLVITSGAMRFQTRYYAIPAKVAESELPAIGTLMHDEADTVTAWRIYEDLTGTVRDKGNRPVVLRYYKVHGTAVTIGDNSLLRLKGYPKQRDLGDGTEYILKYAAAAQAHLPSFGDSYAQDSDAVTGDVFVEIDTMPGLYVGSMTFNTKRAR